MRRLSSFPAPRYSGYGSFVFCMPWIIAMAPGRLRASRYLRPAATLRGSGEGGHSMAFGTEMGMFGTFDGRVDMALITVRTAVSVFEERYK